MTDATLRQHWPRTRARSANRRPPETRRHGNSAHAFYTVGSVGYSMI